MNGRPKHFYIVVISGPICPQKYQRKFASHLSKARAEFAGAFSTIESKGFVCEVISCCLCKDIT